jgi:TRAP-type C4-dicarboxylate transport system substrate-binding protein
MKRPLPPILMAVLAGILPAGCALGGGGGDKAGGSRAPTVLRLALTSDSDDPNAPAARFFAARVAALSHGSLRVQVVFGAAGRYTASTEAQVAGMVRDGRFDLGWIGSRAWDELGVASFQALQAPFLVTSYDLIDRIATGPFASRMLAGLQPQRLVGLALVPDRLRHPFGVRHPLASPADFAGSRVRVIPSRATDALMRALGATPVHISGDAVDAAMAQNGFDGTEHSLGSTWPGGHYLTANVTFFAKADTLFAGRVAFGQLSDDQRVKIRDAARQTVAHVAAHPPPESDLARRYCDGGRVVAASRTDLTALSHAAQPVYAQLERDAQTRSLIAAIRKLKATLPVPPAAAAPDCAPETPAARGRHISRSALNGTYRWRLTKAGAIASGDPDDPDIGDFNSMTLRDGRWRLRRGSTGTYEIVGDIIVFDWPQVASTLQFTFKRHANGDLDMKPVLPMDRGDRFVWAAETWRRVGPPLGAIP